MSVLEKYVGQENPYGWRGLEVRRIRGRAYLMGEHICGFSRKFDTVRSFLEQNSQCRRCTRTKYTPLQLAMKTYERSAKNRSLPFDISVELFELIISMDCFYCGAPPDLKVPGNYAGGVFNEGFLRNEIDRMSPSKGYISNNIVPCCWLCNNMKGSMEFDDFIVYIKNIYNLHFTRNDGVLV